SIKRWDTSDHKYVFNGKTRAKNIVQYTTLKMSGFSGKVAFIPGEETNGNDGLADATSVAVQYGKGNLSLGASFDAGINGEGVDSSRFIAKYKMGAVQFGAMYQNTDNNGVEGDGFLVSIKYISGKNTFKVQTADSDIWEIGKAKYSKQTSIGVEHKLSKKFATYGYYTTAEKVSSGDDSVFGIGMVFKF
ncbi:MAG: porin, partial [Colwellia sp.]|nr:porin [Colwellia sp.]